MKVKHALSIIFTFFLTVLFLKSLLFADITGMVIFGITTLVVMILGKLI